MRTAVSCVEAADAFDKLANMRNIAYSYTDEGCYARTHLMCRQLFDMDIVAPEAVRRGEALCPNPPA
ncbi:MAG TPA: protein-glutamine glutaminase family protein [Alphaproteobacteria bacterium]|nr:protein-glutamine glutaminase family protein [Alphaproteobacteria bacterium]